MFIQKIKKTIEKFSMLEKGDHVVVAVSGGADSVALLSVLNLLKDELGIAVSAAHMDHMIRGDESKKEMAFVQSLAAGMGVECIAEARDVSAVKNDDGLSLQEAAREVRYEFLRETLNNIKADKVAIGHHGDDQVETALMWFVRGASLKGLSGMPPVREGLFIRPLIGVTRKEIEQYLKENNIEYINDTSINEPQYLRNDIRHNLLPLLRKEYNPQIDDAILRMTNLLRQDDELLYSHAKQATDNCIIESDDDLCVSIEKIKEYPEALHGRMIMDMVSRIKGDTRGITFKHVDSVCGLISGGPSKVVQLPQGLCVRREYDKLIFTYKQEQETQFNFSYDSLPESVVIEKTGMKLLFNVLENPDVEKLLKQREPGTEFLDFDKIRFPLVVRSVLPGDRFFPLGMEHSRKLKDFFIDLKIPVRDRSRIPLLVSEGRIACVCGLRIDDRFKIGKGTSRVLSIRIVTDFKG
jgi:tRNA(Ile)-lysidine synthase